MTTQPAVDDNHEISATLARSLTRSHELETEIEEHPEQFRILSGDRPTGNLHLGHYFGTVKNRIDLQNKGVETWILIADYQVITDRDGVGPIKDRVLSLLADYIAGGIDPERSTIFTHSAVPALNQLMLPFLSLVTEAELHRNPTVKSELEASGRAMSGLLLTYPVHQAADILFCQANLVPVGQDQLPHLEQARVIADRFEKRYRQKSSLDKPVFRRPEALLSKAPLILGLDGEKMSKSRHNSIELGMSSDETARLIKKAKTDSERHISYDPVARPEVSNLLTLIAMAEASTPEQVAEEIGDGGAGGLKKRLTDSLNDYLAPHRARRAELLNEPDYLLGVLQAGNERANEIGEATLTQVRTAMNMDYPS
ncbi:MAG: tryptophan--tRNA ligase [Varibaculum sp.]|nr:tryptophan--tRNA ligase [Varibaculum sp.]